MIRTKKGRNSNRSTRQAQIIKSQNLELVAEMYIRGKSHKEIADACGCGLSTVYNYISQARTMWLERAQQAADKIVAEQLARIDTIERESWLAWERSKADAVTKTDEIIPGGKLYSVKKITQRKGQVDDSKFLEIALQCIEKRIKLLKLTGEEQQAVNQNIAIVEVVVESQDQIPKILDYQKFNEIVVPEG